MPILELKNVTKTFGVTTVIDDFSAAIADQEFLVLLGPSGCGKSTLLRMIAGLIEPTRGRIFFGDEDVTDLDPRERNIAFVFQSYALYPHLSVRGNIGFPLVMDRFRWWNEFPLISSVSLKLILRRREIQDRVEAVAEALGLTRLLDRRPKDLSGGERQRVALARSLIGDPKIFLLDEPLSNLDAKLRQQMRVEISTLHRRVKRTFVYVTHDQVEAMTMASRIIVMDRGVIQQIGTPSEIYESPVNLFVAGFIGAPPMNILVGNELSAYRGWADSVSKVARACALPVERLRAGIRPEQIRLVLPGQGPIECPVTVRTVEDHGGSWVYGVEFCGGIHFVSEPRSLSLFPGEAASISFSESDVRWFDAETELALSPPEAW